MGYMYDKQNGYRNADQIGADIEEFNPAVVRAINQAKECEKEIDPDKATRSYINKTSLNIQIENKPKEIINESQEKEKQQMPSYYIAAGIKKEMEQEL